jgi:hypothetical protein
MSAKADAKKLVNDFAARKTGGNLWKSITRTDLANGLLVRLDNPELIEQGKAGLCAPASLIYSLANDDPVAYARAAVELWETGRTAIGGLKIKAGSDLMDYQLPATKTVPAADWILLASMRDSENWFFDYESVNDSGSTRPGETVKWMEKMGYQDVIDRMNSLFKSSSKTAKEASDLVSKGYKVLLRINSAMLDKVDANGGSWRGNHIVALVSPITFNLTTVKVPAGKPDCFRDAPGPRVCYTPPETSYETGTLSFKVYTWGSIRNVPYSGTLTLLGFINSYYGYAAGKY